MAELSDLVGTGTDTAQPTGGVTIEQSTGDITAAINTLMFAHAVSDAPDTASSHVIPPEITNQSPGLCSISSEFCLVQPAAENRLHEVNSIEPPSQHANISLHQLSSPPDYPVESTLQEPNVNTLKTSMDTFLPDMSSITPELGLTKPSQVGVSVSPAQHVDNISYETNSVQSAVDPTQLVEKVTASAPRVLRTKRSFTTEFKLECVEHAERTKNKTQTAKIFNVNRRRVQEWCSQKSRLMSVPKQQKRLSGVGKRPFSVDVASMAVKSDGGVQGDRLLASKSELESDVMKDFSCSAVPTISNSTLDSALLDCIARNFSNIDHSMLPASIVKILQEWSGATSNDGKTSMGESVIPDAIPIEDVLQRRSDFSPSNEFLVIEGKSDGHQAKKFRKVEIGDDERVQTLAAQHSTSSIQQRVVVEEFILGNNGHRSVDIEGPVVNMGLADVNQPTVSADITDLVNQAAQHMVSKEAGGFSGHSDLVGQYSTSAMQQQAIAAEFINGASNKYNTTGIEEADINIDVMDINKSIVNTCMSEELMNQAALHTASSTLSEALPGSSNPLPQHSASAIQQGIAAAAEFILGNNSHNSIQGPNVKGSNLMDQQPSHTDTEVKNPSESNDISSLIPENNLSSAGPVALLDALMQVAAVQMEPQEETTTLAASVAPAIRARVKKTYTVEFKLDCIAYAESTSKCAAARQFNVDRRRVQDWCSKKEKLQKLVDGHHLLRGARERMDTDIEKQLVAWIKQQQETGEHLTRKMVGDEATKMYQEKGDMEFLSSIGWVAKFMVRNNISLVACSSLPLRQCSEDAADGRTHSSL